MEQYPHLDLGIETQSVHTLDELERSDALSYLGKISVGDVQVHVRHESANHEYTICSSHHPHSQPAIVCTHSFPVPKVASQREIDSIHPPLHAPENFPY